MVGYEGRYEVSDLGRVRSLYREWTDTWGRNCHRNGIVLKQQINAWGYPIVKLYRHAGKGRNTNVAHIVIEAFVGSRPDGMEVCHGDGYPANSALTNLRYDTPVGNQADRVRHGTHNRGSRHPRAKLCEDDVIQIRMMVRDGMAPTWAIAEAFGIAASGVSNIVAGRTWRHINGD